MSNLTLWDIQASAPIFSGTLEDCVAAMLTEEKSRPDCDVHIVRMVNGVVQMVSGQELMKIHKRLSKGEA